MTGPYIAVDPADFTNSAKNMAQANVGTFNTFTNLSTALASTGGMAGDDEVGVKFAHAYDSAASSLINLAGQYVQATGNVARALHTSSKNHANANEASKFRPGPANPSPPLEFSVATGTFTAPPAAEGNTSGIPGFLAAIRRWVQVVWPNADVAALRSAAAAWQDAGKLMPEYATDCTNALSDLGDMSTGELKTATACCTTLSTVATDFGTALNKLGDACNSFADHVENQREQMKQEIEKFLAATILIEGTGAIVGALTLEIGEGAAQVVEADRAAALAVRLAELEETLAVLAELDHLMVENVEETATTLATDIALYAAAGNVVDFRGTKVSWAQVWAMPDKQRGNVIEDFLGQNLPQAYKTWDWWDAKSGTAISIKSMNTEAGRYKNEPSRIRSKLLDYVREAAHFTDQSRLEPRIAPRQVKTRIVQLVIPATTTGATDDAIKSALDTAHERWPNVQVEVVRL